MFGPATAGASLGSAVVIIGVKRYTHEVMSEHQWPHRGCCACSMNGMLGGTCSAAHRMCLATWHCLGLDAAGASVWCATIVTVMQPRALTFPIQHCSRPEPGLSLGASAITNTCCAYK